MRILEANSARAFVSGLVHFDTQQARNGLDLTVDAVYRVTGPGQLDFGGSELESAGREELTPELRAPDDDYGWWILDAGTYLVRYNESLDLAPGQLARVYPLPRLLRAGTSHAAFVADGGQDPLETLLTVGETGCQLKENCRVSRLVVMEAS